MRGSSRLLALSVLALSGRASALGAEGFTLETGSPDALCPELATTREVVARRLGALVVEGRRGWRARYTIAHAPSGSPRDFIRLELFNPEGERELVRDLPIEGDSCRTMAEVIALVLDRYFRGLGGGEDNTDAEAEEPRQPAGPREAESTPRTPLAARLPPSVSTAPASAEQQHESGSDRASELRSSVSEPALRLMLRLNDSVPDAQASVGLLTLYPIFGSLHLGAAVTKDLSSREQSLGAGASVRSSAVSARAFAAWGREIAGSFIYIGPAIAVALDRGSGSALAMTRDQSRAIWAAGFDAGLMLALTHNVFFSWSTNLDVRLPGAAGAFAVDGREVLAPRSVVWGWGVGLGYAFSVGRGEDPRPRGL